MRAFFLSLFFASKRLYVFRVLEFFFFGMGWCARALSRQTKKKLSRRLYTFQISLSLRFQNAVGLLWPRRESLLPKKKRGTPKTPAKLCCFDSFFGEGARARFENERERERDGELFLRRERDLEEYI